MNSKKKDPTKNKARGSNWEREAAKKLSIWLYDDPDVLKRTPSSGADKTISASDIMIMKQTDRIFQLHIECKTGYEKKQDIFNAVDQINMWYEVAKQEKGIQDPVWILWRIPYKGILLASDRELLDQKSIAIIPKPNIFVYVLEEILEHMTKDEFFRLFGKEN